MLVAHLEQGGGMASDGVGVGDIASMTPYCYNTYYDPVRMRLSTVLGVKWSWRWRLTARRRLLKSVFGNQALEYTKTSRALRQGWGLFVCVSVCVYACAKVHAKCHILAEDNVEWVRMGQLSSSSLYRLALLVNVCPA